LVVDVPLLADRVFQGTYRNPHVSTADTPTNIFLNLVPKVITLAGILFLAWRFKFYFVITCCVNFTLFPAFFTPLFLGLQNPLAESIFSISQADYVIAVVTLLMGVRK
jgi:hypothetical protein